jgi:hypothetical protein
MSRELGAATVARPRLAPDERLLWASYGDMFVYDVRGHDELGARKRALVSRGLRATGSAAGGVLIETLFLTDDSPGKPKPPDLLVIGERKEGMAHDLVSAHGEPKTYQDWLWALTSHRLLLLGPEPVPQQESWGRLAFGLGKAAVGVFTGSAKEEGDRPPYPVPPRDLLGEVPREGIANVTPARRGRRPCLRVSFVDGSGLEFFFQVTDPAVVEWMVR